MLPKRAVGTNIQYTWADPGFQVRGGALKKIAPSEGRRENFWGISCEKSRFYAKKSYFFPILGGGGGAGLTGFPTFLTLQDKHKMRTLSLNIRFICTRCETGLKSSPKSRYSACF
jgi:hypothetical protein